MDKKQLTVAWGKIMDKKKIKWIITREGLK